MGDAIRFGYKASAEQFGPRELLDYSVRAERAGLGIVAISDHFQPWRHHGGHAPAALPWLAAAGAETSAATLGTSVLTPTLRYQPAVIAQAFATLGCLYPGRVFLGVGTGEAMNETPVTGDFWPPIKERRRRLAEAIRLIKELWTSERVSFEGEYYKTSNATIYDRPGAARPGLRRGQRAARRQARRPRRRGLHLHQRQGPGALQGAARARSGRAPRPPSATPRRSPG